MQRPGQFSGSVITATGVTPEIVLVIFLILCFSVIEFNRFQSMPTLREVYDKIAPARYGLHHWTRFRRELDTLASKWQNGRLLNLGCGHGADFLPFKDNFELYGADFSAVELELAQKYALKFDFFA